MSAALFKRAKLKALTAAILGMFAGGAVPGVFLDANDRGPTGTGGTGVVFQDLSGTAVTAMEQPVQLILDKSQGLKLGSELVVNGSNLVDTSSWVAQNSTLVAVGGQLQVTNTSGALYGSGGQVVSGLTVGKMYKVVVTFTKGTSDGRLDINGVSNVVARSTSGVMTWYFVATGTTAVVSCVNTTLSVGAASSYGPISCKSIAGNHAYVSASANRPTITARYNLLLATAVLSTQSVTVGAGSYTLYFTGSGSVALSGAATGTKTAGSNVITCTAGTLTLTVTGSVLTADLRPTDQATGLIPTYQRVNTATDYDWSPAFPPMIKGNGSNQYLTGKLNLSSTNKVTVWAGVRKTGDSVAGVLFETSTVSDSTNGSLALTVSTSAFTAQARGTSLGYYQPTIPAAPTTKTLRASFDLSGGSLAAQVIPAINGVVTQTGGGGTTGSSVNFTSQPYYLLSRAGTAYFMNGGFNSLIILGAAASAAQISATEAWANSKVRAYA